MLLTAMLYMWKRVAGNPTGAAQTFIVRIGVVFTFRKTIFSDCICIVLHNNVEYLKLGDILVKT